MHLERGLSSFDNARSYVVIFLSDNLEARHDSGYIVVGRYGMGMVLANGYHRQLTLDSDHLVLVLNEVEMSGTRAADAAATPMSVMGFTYRSNDCSP